MTRKQTDHWNLIPASEATPLRLEQPHTTVVLSTEEADWYSRQRTAAASIRVHSAAAEQQDEQTS